MPLSASYREFVADQLSALGSVAIKRMFGGAGLYFDGRMFGLIDEDTLYLRVDDETRPEFLARGMTPFHPVRRDPKRVSLNYYQLPAEVLEDSDQLVVWAKRAIKASLSPTAAVARKRAAKSPIQRKRRVSK
jgi:DNA transformation protein and related proteins